MKFTESAKAEGWDDNNIDDVRCMMDENILEDVRAGFYINEKLEKVLAEYSKDVAEFSTEEIAEIEEALLQVEFEEENRREAEEYRQELLYWEAIRMRPYMTGYERFRTFGEYAV